MFPCQLQGFNERTQPCWSNNYDNEQQQRFLIRNDCRCFLLSLVLAKLAPPPHLHQHLHGSTRAARFHPVLKDHI